MLVFVVVLHICFLNANICHLLLLFIVDSTHYSDHF